MRRIQIREAIRAHFEKERRLFSQDIKVLSLFFIDEVKKYRDYERTDERGQYARIFEEDTITKEGVFKRTPPRKHSLPKALGKHKC